MSINLTMDSLLNEAKTTTGLEDFGNNSFEEGLNLLITSCNNEGEFNDAGYHMTHNRIFNFLSIVFKCRTG